MRELAVRQHGLFSERQAEECGLGLLSLRLLLTRNRIEPVRWRIFRLSGSPPSPVEPVVLAWLWSGREGVVSHETALALHGLGELSEPLHLTLPPGHARRYHRHPAALRLHLEPAAEDEVDLVLGLPALCLERTLAQTLRSLPRAGIRHILEQVAERLLLEREAGAPVSES